MIQTGVAYLGADMPGWNLNTGTGDRSFRTPDIPFDPPFPAPPKITLALKGIDSEARLGIDVFPDDVEPEEFNIIIKTWSETVLYNVSVTWIAFDG